MFHKLEIEKSKAFLNEKPLNNVQVKSKVIKAITVGIALKFDIGSFGYIPIEWPIGEN